MEHSDGSSSGSIGVFPREAGDDHQMNERLKKRAYMRNMLSRCYSEEGRSKVSKSSLDYTSRLGSWDSVVSALEAWEDSGILKIVKDPRIGADDEVCVVFKTFFDGQRFPDHWIRD